MLITLFLIVVLKTISSAEKAFLIFQRHLLLRSKPKHLTNLVTPTHSWGHWKPGRHQNQQAPQREDQQPARERCLSVRERKNTNKVNNKRQKQKNMDNI